MALFTVRGGEQIETATPDEVRGIVREARVAERAAELEHFRGVKWMRLPQLQGSASAGALSLGAASQYGPDQGYAWCLRRVTVTGLTSGTSPDVVNLYFNDSSTGQPIIWQFNGNNFGYTFGKCELTLRSGDILFLKSTGTFAATGNIIMAGEMIEVPAEMLPKLAL